MVAGVPWVIENVLEAPIRKDLILCGSMFRLKIRRHRGFEFSRPIHTLLPTCDHRCLLPFMHKGERAYADAMECNWMTNREGRNAIPPAYSEFIGKQILQHITDLAVSRNFGRTDSANAEGMINLRIGGAVGSQDKPHTGIARPEKQPLLDVKDYGENGPDEALCKR